MRSEKDESLSGTVIMENERKDFFFLEWEVMECSGFPLFNRQCALRYVVYHSLSPSNAMSFPWKLVWRLKVPSRVAFFSWTAALGKMLSIDNLQKRRVIVLDWCSVCKKCGQSVGHFLLHFPIAYELWTMAFYLFGPRWNRGVIHTSMKVSGQNGGNGT